MGSSRVLVVWGDRGGTNLTVFMFEPTLFIFVRFVFAMGLILAIRGEVSCGRRGVVLSHGLCVCNEYNFNDRTEK